MILTACHTPQENTYSPSFADASPLVEQEYLFAVHPLHNPQRLFEVFQPLMSYLSEETPNATFRLETSRNYAAYEEKLYSGKFHFSLPNPFQTINAIDKGYRVIAKMADDENFRGIILVRKDSGIKQVSDLKNSAVSYPAPTALAATMLPQYYLQTHGIEVMSELDNHYVGSQESSIMNVYLGQTQAAATWPPPWRALLKERPELEQELQVIWETTPLVNNSVVVLPDVPNDVVAQVTKLLTTLHENERGRRILDAMQLSRFELASSGTYQVVRTFVEDFSSKVRPLK